MMLFLILLLGTMREHDTLVRKFYAYLNRVFQMELMRVGELYMK